MQVNSNSSQLHQLMNQRNKSIIEMVQDVQSGNISGAQSALGQMQTANKSLGIDDSTDSSSSSTTSTTPSAGLSSMKNDLTAMMSAVQSGDLTSAQAAWSKVQANMASGAPQGSMPPPPPPGPPPSASSTSSTDSASSTDDGATDAATNDLTTLLNAVQSGDADTMKSSATAFAKDLKTLLGTSSTNASTSTASTSSTSSTGNPILDDLNALVQAAQSGDATSAKAAQQKLDQDMQSTQHAEGAGHAHHHHHGGGKPPVDPSTTAATTSAATASTLLATDTTTATTTDTTTAAA